MPSYVPRTKDSPANRIFFMTVSWLKADSIVPPGPVCGDDEIVFTPSGARASESIKVEHLLGRGALSAVYSAMWRNEVVALRVSGFLSAYACLSITQLSELTCAS